MIRGILMLTFLTVVAWLVPLSNAFVCGTPARSSTQMDRGLSGGRSRSSSSTSLTTMMAAEKNRRGRRYKKKDPSKNAPARTNKPASDAKWLQVLDKAPEMELGGVKVVSGKYKGDDKFFALAKHGGKFFAVSEACGRCKFPMINGKVKLLLGDGEAEDVKEGVEQNPDDEVAIGCPLCGAMFDLRTGSVAGEKPKGLAQNIVSKLVSQTPADEVKSYPAQELSNGAVVVRVD